MNPDYASRTMSAKIPATMKLIADMRGRGRSIRDIVTHLNRVQAETVRPGATWNIRQVQLALKQLGLA